MTDVDVDQFKSSLAARGIGPPSPGASTEAHRLVLVEQAVASVERLRERLHDVVELTAALFDAPRAGITLVGDQLILVPITHGSEPYLFDRHGSGDHWSLAEPGGQLVISDAAAEPASAERLAVHAAFTPQALRAYAGSVLTGQHGERLGALWVGSRQPLTLDPADLGRLRVLADVVSDLIRVDHADAGLLEPAATATLAGSPQVARLVGPATVVALRIIGSDGEFLDPPSVRSAVTTAARDDLDPAMATAEDGIILLADGTADIEDLLARLGRLTGALGAGVQLLHGSAVTPATALADPAQTADLVHQARSALRQALPRERTTRRRPSRAQVPALQLDRRRAAAEIVIEVQPIVELASMRIRGLECLARWDHPERGRLLPGAFLPGMSRASLDRLLEVALDQTWRYAARLAELGRDVIVSVNVPPHSLAVGFADGLAQRSLATGVDPNRIAIEVLETEPGHAIVEVRDEIAALRRLGFRVSIDDFGTGASNVDVLLAGLADSVKIDQVITSGIDKKRSHRLMLESVAEVAELLGAGLVVEGIERRSQLAVAREVGVTYVQGFLFGASMPFEEALSALDTDFDALRPDADDDDRVKPAGPGPRRPARPPTRQPG